MTALPTGTVSLLFSDIEGSTRLLRRLGDSYAEALDAQRHILRDAWRTHDGSEMGTEGDSFFVAFRTAPDAVGAAVDAQLGLAAHPWPQDQNVRVRMGIHTGAPRVHEDAYVGLDVHRAARIAAAAHGGQVVVSEATARLVDDVALLDLGSHRLKDLPRPEHLFQVLVDDERFPPPKSLGTASSLPVPATPLVGRDEELSELTSALSGRVRLLTLTGAGGTGKTRLAVAIAHEMVGDFPDGVFFVGLSNIGTAEAMWAVIADRLDMPSDGRAPSAMISQISHGRALLVLDNLEQINGANAVVSELLTGAPDLVVVATSRRPLHLSAEHEHAVLPLSLPTDSDPEGAERSDAVRLFVQNARKVKPSFAIGSANAADVTAVCRKLDGLPLAIELAAARIKLLSPAALLARLDSALELRDTAIDRPGRQQTLRQTIAWSYDLLTPEEQVFFGQLGVFGGGADLDAVAAVTETVDPIEPVAVLVDASLLSVTEDSVGEPRIQMLSTVRTFARDAQGNEAARARHGRHFLELATALAGRFDGDERNAVRGRFETERENFREAMRWSLDARPAEALELCAALGTFWVATGDYAEGQRWTTAALAAAEKSASSARAECLRYVAVFAEIRGDLEDAAASVAASVDAWRAVGDGQGLARALATAASIETMRRDFARARELYAEALTVARDNDDKRNLHWILGDMAWLESLDGDNAKAIAMLEESLAFAREIVDPRSCVMTQANLACLMREIGRLGEAQQQFREVIVPMLRLREPRLDVTLAEDYAALLAEIGDHVDAAELVGAAEAMREEFHNPRNSSQQQAIGAAIEKARQALGDPDWDEAYRRGRTMSVDATLTRHIEEDT